MKLKPFVSKAAFLSDDKAIGEAEAAGEIEVEVHEFQLKDLEDMDDDDISFSPVDVADGDDKSVYIQVEATR